MLITEAGGRLRDRGELSAAIGMATHDVVAEFAAKGRRPSHEELGIASTMALRSLVVGPGALRASRLTVAALVGTYFSWFWHRTWRLEPASGGRSGGRPDLIWRLPFSRYVIDELKTSSVAHDVTQFETQLEDYLELGSARYGPMFEGVRLCPLRAPRLAAFYAADLRREGSPSA